MSFTFTNYAGIRPQEHPLNDILGKVLSGYTDTTKARYLEPGLAEALKKSKLYNQYYGRDMESKIGSRGAAAAHANALTTGQNITNQYLPEKHKAELQAYLQKAKEKQMFQQMLQQHLGGNRTNQSQSNYSSQQEQQPTYTPGQGDAPFAQQHAEMQQHMQQQLQNNNPQEEEEEEEEEESPYTQQQEQEEAPKPSNEDILNKHYFKLDTFTPKLKAYNQQQAKKQEAINKDIQTYKKEAPVLVDQLKDVDYLIKETKKHPELFGAGWFGYDIHGPSYRARNFPSKVRGRMTTKMQAIISRASKELSSEPLALALSTAIGMKPGFDNTSEDALGKLEGIKESLLHTLGRTNSFYKGHTGSNLVNSKAIREQLSKLEPEEVTIHYKGQVFDVPKDQAHKYEGKPGVIIEK